MNFIYVRPLRLNDEADTNAFIESWNASFKFIPNNAFALPTTRIMVAEKMEGNEPRIIGYQPQLVPLVLGSFVGQGSSMEVASALRALTAAAYTRANTEGMSELLAFSNTPETSDFAARHGFTEAHKALRMDVR